LRKIKKKRKPKQVAPTVGIYVHVNIFSGIKIITRNTIMDCSAMTNKKNK